MLVSTVDPMDCTPPTAQFCTHGIHMIIILTANDWQLMCGLETRYVIRMSSLVYTYDGLPCFVGSSWCLDLCGTILVFLLMQSSLLTHLLLANHHNLRVPETQIVDKTAEVWMKRSDTQETLLGEPERTPQAKAAGARNAARRKKEYGYYTVKTTDDPIEQGSEVLITQIVEECQKPENYTHLHLIKMFIQSGEAKQSRAQRKATQALSKKAEWDTTIIAFGHLLTSWAQRLFSMDEPQAGSRAHEEEERHDHDNLLLVYFFVSPFCSSRRFPEQAAVRGLLAGSVARPLHQDCGCQHSHDP